MSTPVPSLLTAWCSRSERQARLSQQSQSLSQQFEEEQAEATPVAEDHQHHHQQPPLDQPFTDILSPSNVEDTGMHEETRMEIDGEDEQQQGGSDGTTAAAAAAAAVAGEENEEEEDDSSGETSMHHQLLNIASPHYASDNEGAEQEEKQEVMVEDQQGEEPEDTEATTIPSMSNAATASFSPFASSSVPLLPPPPISSRQMTDAIEHKYDSPQPVTATTAADAAVANEANDPHQQLDSTSASFPLPQLKLPVVRQAMQIEDVADGDEKVTRSATSGASASISYLSAAPQLESRQTPLVLTLQDSLPQQSLTAVAQINQMIDEASQIDSATIHFILKDLHSTSSPSTADSSSLMRDVAHRIISETTEKNDTSQHARTQQSEKKGSNEPFAPLPVALLITHILDECIAPPVTTSRTSSIITLELAAGLGKKLGDAMMQGGAVLKASDLHRARKSIVRVVNLHILTTDSDSSTERLVTTFLRSLGYSCSPFVLYCLLHLLDQHIEATTSTNRLDDGAIKNSSVRFEDLLNEDGTRIVSHFDFMENSCKLCRLIELILLHINTSIAIPSSSSSSASASASSSSSSASMRVFQTQLACLVMDWTRIWYDQFCALRLQSIELAMSQPILLEYLWQILGCMSRDMQVQSMTKL